VRAQLASFGSQGDKRRRGLGQLVRKIVVLLSVAVVLFAARNAIKREPEPGDVGPGADIVDSTLQVEDRGALRQRAWDAAMRFDSYLSVMVEEVGLARWADRTTRPLKIYVPDSELTGYTADHRRAVLDAFGRWSRVGPSVIPVFFTFVGKQENADVSVEWEPYLTEGKAGLATMTRNGAGWIQTGRLSLALGTADGRTFLPSATYTIALHEIGHLLGLGHSDDPGDVMYPTAGVQDLSLRDRTTARLLYQIEPGPVPR
jgi:predicted Zn-dependent protease